MQLKRNALNKLLLLRLIQRASGISGATRLQKLVFTSESLGRKRDTQTFNYKFIRWHYGPYSTELKSDVDFLTQIRLITNDDNWYSITAEGNQLLQRAEQIIIQQSPDVVFQEVIKTYNNMPLDKLLWNVYEQFEIEKKYEKGEVIEPVFSNDEEEIGELV